MILYLFEQGKSKKKSKKATVTMGKKDDTMEDYTAGDYNEYDDFI